MLRATARRFPPALVARYLGACGASAVLLAFALAAGVLLTSWQYLGLSALGGLLGLAAPTRRALWVAVVSLGLALALCLGTPVLRPALDALVASSPPRRADAIVVLGGGMHCGSGELASSSLARLVRGLELWRAGYAPTLVLSDTFERGCPSVGVAQRELARRVEPAPGPEIVLLPRMLTTRTEAVAAADLARRRGWSGVLLVTSPTHTRRAAAAFARAGLPALPVASSEPGFDLKLPDPADRLDALRTLTREHLGWWLYARRGWL